MKTGVKERLVGATLLVCIGIVAWAWLFGGSPGPAVDTSSRIPVPEAMTPQAVPQPRRPASAHTAPADAAGEPAAAPEDLPPPVQQPPAQGEPAPGMALQPEEELADQPLLDADGLPLAWVIQVASLSRRDAAVQLRDRLREAGHRAYVEPERRNGGEVYRVLVGPHLSRAEAESVKAAIDTGFSVDALIRRFQPVPE